MDRAYTAIFERKGSFMEEEAKKKDMDVVPVAVRRMSVRAQDDADVRKDADAEVHDGQTESEKSVMEEAESAVFDETLAMAPGETSAEVSEAAIRNADRVGAALIEKAAMKKAADTGDDGRARGIERIRGITQASKSEKRAIYSDQGLIPLGEEALFKTEGQQRHEDYIALVSSRRGHNYLTGTIFSVTTQGGHICAVVRYGCFTVLIPSEKLLSSREERAIEEAPDENRRFLMRRRFATQRIGSQIDFVVEAVDEVEMIAVGNRHEAMEIKKQAWYLSHDQNNEPLLNRGTRAEARVVVVTRNMMFVEVFGMEFMLREHDIAYVQIPDVAAEYPVGSTVPAIFTKLEREHTESGITIHAQVSVRDAVSDPRKREFNAVQVKDILVATVTGIIEDGIIVRVGGMEGKQDALCQYRKKNPTFGYSLDDVPPIGRNVLIKIRKKEEFDSRQNPIYRIYGDILRVF